jgi:nucleotide-binding universal stress UspA family protein
MRRAILGVDLSGVYRHAEQLLTELKIPDLHVSAVCSIEPIIPDIDPTGLSHDHPLAEALGAQRDCAVSEVTDVCSRLSDSTVSAEGTTPLAGAVNALTDAGRSQEADLIAIGSQRRGVLSSLFLGSVTKGLVIEAQRSVLVGKAECSTDGLAIVIATDHSDYADRCINRLVEWAPKGISKITILSAYEVDDLARSAAFASHPEVAAFAPEKLASRLADQGMELADRLAPLGADVEVKVVEGDADNVIMNAAKELQPDLVVLGAQGHGFIERHTLGSTSMHLTLAGEFNLLILRV